MPVIEPVSSIGKLPPRPTFECESFPWYRLPPKIVRACEEASTKIPWLKLAMMLFISVGAAFSSTRMPMSVCPPPVSVPPRPYSVLLTIRPNERGASGFGSPL